MGVSPMSWWSGMGETPMLRKDRAIGVGVNVHSVFAEEGDQGLVALDGEIDRERGRRGDGGDDRDAGREAFLKDFEGGAAADQENVLVEGEKVVQQRMTEDLVNGVVAAYVFSED